MLGGAPQPRKVPLGPAASVISRNTAAVLFGIVMPDRAICVQPRVVLPVHMVRVMPVAGFRMLPEPSR